MHTTTLKPAGRSMGQMTRDVVSLFKLRIGVLIMITALVGMAVAPGPAPSFVQVLILAVSVLLASASAGAFNQYVEYESDRLMARTAKRAFATGALPHHPAWLVLMAVLLALTIGGSHYLIDVAKSYSNNGLAAFLLDQLAHLAVLLLLWSGYTDNWQWWPPQLQAEWLLVALAYLLVLTPASVLIGQLLRSWRPELLTLPAQGLLAGGHYIGMLERALLLTFVLLDQFGAVGFLLAAKSIFRFGDLSRAQDVKLTEYVLLGTLLSIGISLSVGLLLRWAVGPFA